MEPGEANPTTSRDRVAWDASRRTGRCGSAADPLRVTRRSGACRRYCAGLCTGWISARSGEIVARGVSGTYTTLAGSHSPVPIVFDETVVTVRVDEATLTFTLRIARVYTAVQPSVNAVEVARAVHLTKSQHRLIVVLAEPALGAPAGAPRPVPTSVACARRLGWTVTAFNRKLDSVCEKFDRAGVMGLRGGPGRLAVRRRARVVEIAVAARIVTVKELALLYAIPDERDVTAVAELQSQHESPAPTAS